MDEKEKGVVDRLDVAATTLLDTAKKVEARVTAVESAWQTDLKALADQVKKDGEQAVRRTDLTQAVNEIMARQDAEQMRNKLFNDSAREKVKLVDPWTTKGDYLLYDTVSPGSLLKLGRKGLEMAIMMEPIDDTHRAFQRMAADVQIADAMARANYIRITGDKMQRNYPGFALACPKISAKWAWYQRRFLELYGGETKAAIEPADLTDTANWVPSGWSTEMRELIAIELRVAALFQHIPIPMGVKDFTIPLDLTDTVADLIPEAATFLDPYVASDPWQLGQTINDSKITLTAGKLRARFMLSQELNEDAIITVLALARNKAVKTIANGLEKAIIDGQSSGTIDTNDAPGTYDCRKLCDGLRKHCVAATSKVDMGAALTATKVIGSMRQQLGERGVDLGNLVYIPGPSSYIQMLVMTELLTVDKLGMGATVLRGQMGAIGGVPIVPSRFIRQDLHTDGTVQVTSALSTCLLLARTDCFAVGDKRAVTVTTDYLAPLDQYDVIALARYAFSRVFASATKQAVMGHNITS